MKSKDYIWLMILVFVILLATVIMVVQPFGDREYGPNLIVGLIGALISAFFTIMLLRNQTNSEEERNKSIKMYENKLRAFAEFNKFLWEKDELDDAKLRQSCMQNLVFYLENDKIQQLIEYAKIIKSTDKKGVRDNAKAEILRILKESLNEKDKIDAKTIKNLYAILTPEQGFNNTPKMVKNDAQLATEEEQAQSADISTNQVDQFETPDNDNHANLNESPIPVSVEELKNHFQISEDVTFWHFNALEPDKQAKRLTQDDPILSLIEYGESWRTERLQEVKPGDIIFLFYRGGPGYIGMYRAQATQVFKNIDVTDGKSDVEVYLDGVLTENIAYNDKRLQDNDIYEAIADGGDYVANILVKELATQKEWGNPCGSVIRQTIARMSGERVETLLRYFYQSND